MGSPAVAEGWDSINVGRLRNESRYCSSRVGRWGGLMSAGSRKRVTCMAYAIDVSSIRI